MPSFVDVSLQTNRQYSEQYSEADFRFVRSIDQVFKPKLIVSYLIYLSTWSAG